MSRQVNCVYLAPRLATMIESYLLALNCYTILSVHKVFRGETALLLMSVKWRFRRLFCLWSDPRQVTSPAIRPIKRCRVGCDAVLS